MDDGADRYVSKRENVPRLDRRQPELAEGQHRAFADRLLLGDLASRSLLLRQACLLELLALRSLVDSAPPLSSEQPGLQLLAIAVASRKLAGENESRVIVMAQQVNGLEMHRHWSPSEALVDFWLLDEVEA